MPDRGLRSAGDDELVGSRPVAKELRLDVLLDQLDREQLAIDRERAVSRRPPEKIGARCHPGLGRLLGPADSRELRAALDAPALAEHRLVGADPDAALAEPLGHRERKAVGDDCLLDAQCLAGVRIDLAANRVAVEALRDQLVVAVLLEGMRFDSAQGTDPFQLERRHDGAPHTVGFDVEECVRNAEGHLMADLRAAKRVADDEQGGHEAILSTRAGR